MPNPGRIRSLSFLRNKSIRFPMVQVKYKFDFVILFQVHILQNIQSILPILTTLRQLQFQAILRLKKMDNDNMNTM